MLQQGHRGRKVRGHHPKAKVKVSITQGSFWAYHSGGHEVHGKAPCPPAACALRLPHLQPARLQQCFQPRHLAARSGSGSAWGPSGELAVGNFTSATVLEVRTGHSELSVAVDM